jgi:hypothetical protein
MTETIEKPVRPPPKSLDDVFSAILSDIGVTEEEIGRLGREELVQDSKGRMWAVGKPTPIDHPKVAQTTAILFEEGPEVRAYSVPSAGTSTIGFAVWKFRTDQTGFRFVFLPLETWQAMVGREFERQLDELDGEESEADAMIAYMRAQHPATSLPTVLLALTAGKHLEEDDGEEPEPKTPEPPNGAAATPATTTPPAPTA